jgi:asparaginyl-tRNA synthetase
VYIDEKAGSDTTGTGAELAPYATALAAYQSLKPQPSSDATPTSVANLLVRKADSVERNEWVELSASAKKKLVRLIEQWRKKEAEERDRLKREEAKSVVLVDDSSKGEAKRVNLPCELRSSGWGWG